MNPRGGAWRGHALGRQVPWAGRVLARKAPNTRPCSTAENPGPPLEGPPEPGSRSHFTPANTETQREELTRPRPLSKLVANRD